MTAPNLPRDANAEAIQALFPGTVQKVAFGAGATPATSALKKTTRVVRLFTEEECNFAMSGTSLTTDTPLAAKLPEYFAVRGEETLSFINPAGASGSFYITEME